VKITLGTKAIKVGKNLFQVWTYCGYQVFVRYLAH